MLQVSTSEITNQVIPSALNETVLGPWRPSSDLSLAIAVQRRMLPAKTRQLATAKYAGMTSAARGVGGDYYDFLDLGQAALGVLLADVSGKGVAAALLMANLQAAIRCVCAHPCASLPAMLQQVNAHFFESTLPEQYATLFFSRYDDSTRRLDYVNCGQEPAIILRNDGSVEWLEGTALPLGLFYNWSGEQRTVELQSGDLLCVCSDGVVEAGLEHGSEFGVEGLISVIASDREREAEAVVARIAHAMRAFAPDGLTDDATVVAVRVA